ncbi:hypothetical protein JOB18_031526 [Solea senegalensis]|uniref:Uncharacterized protein n=1 Tax=Solea senegalensis TaxID=28829 RepID=A0AAV6P9V8_SOLSE|nr:hypothetical protein JOB18_031526 [Solea senegalensis]
MRTTIRRENFSIQLPSSLLSHTTELYILDTMTETTAAKHLQTCSICFGLASCYIHILRRGRAETSEQQAEARSRGNCIGGCFLSVFIVSTDSQRWTLLFPLTLLCLDHAEFLCLLLLSQLNSVLFPSLRVEVWTVSAAAAAAAAAGVAAEVS